MLANVRSQGAVRASSSFLLSLVAGAAVAAALAGVWELAFFRGYAEAPADETVAWSWGAAFWALSAA